MENQIYLLDCSLRDGGYINDWKWGDSCAREIIRLLQKANVDIIEIGFLRDIGEWNKNIVIARYLEDLNTFCSKFNKKNKVAFSAMMMCSNYSLKCLSDYSGSGIEMIRVTAHDYDLSKGFDYAFEIKKRGYKVSVNPINIMGYNDCQILNIIDKVNKIDPFQFSIVDTFGSMRMKDLQRLFSLIDNNLNSDIRIGIHLHENMSFSFSLAQEFLEKHMNRKITVDGSLLGIGRTPGNLPIELIADYLNENYRTKYDINYMLDAIQDYIEPMKGESKWGYSPAYFLSAKYNLHRNYAEYLLNKGNLTHRDINSILVKISNKNKSVYDEEIISFLYDEYINHKVDDTEDIEKLKNEFRNREILLLAPGNSLKKYKDRIINYIHEKKPIVISLNFFSEVYNIDYAFFGNMKRYERNHDIDAKIIIASNIHSKKFDYIIDFSKFNSKNNIESSMILFLNFLKKIGTDNVILAGADGYEIGCKNYYEDTFENIKEYGEEYNKKIGQGLKMVGINIKFLTPSSYEKYI